MSYQIDYDGFHRFAKTNRPYASIFCYGVKPPPGSPPVRLAALIDTGADYLVLPNYVGQKVGLNLHNYPSSPVLTAGGNTPATIVKDFTIKLEGVSIEVTAQFLNITRALLGLSPLLRAIDFGLSVNRRWFFKK
jgi:predicted aspartyl protease